MPHIHLVMKRPEGMDMSDEELQVLMQTKFNEQVRVAIRKRERRYPRAKVLIPVKWGMAPNCRFEGVIAILSLGGCLIQTHLHASLGQAVFVRMLLGGDGEDANVPRGHVKYEMEGNGLGV